MLQEFKAFAMRGNVVDLAIGVVIGAAFGKIVDSLVNDIIMPIIGAITGGLDFSNIYIPLSSKVSLGMAYADAKKAGAVMGIGNFINTLVFFIIIAWVLFMVVKAISKLQREQAAAPAAAPAPTTEQVLLGEIRDLLAAKA
ncbi:large-conductance mechanosensitive channel [Alsobacter metallidurans]|uniref:Large-conductance mechanosensitive channel n=1 Tax=Alsobacter metallidurans TaxID=340221 RepID=A0A917I500_9HYPH|nr:large conductance mechanosensitive channel protein MscL [Alsobacter metallidurans]GGH10377.1 large-conductance mechanosensitive channel [Alsobacter metallidurans]